MDVGILPAKLPSIINPDTMNSFLPEPPRKSFGATNTTSNQQPETPRKPFSLIDPGNILPLVPSQSPHGVVREDENQMPMPISTPKTPLTALKPMQMATTPATVARVLDEKEYSFEERRLAVYQRR